MAYMGLKCSAWIWDLIRRDQCLMYIDSDQFSAKQQEQFVRGFYFLSVTLLKLLICQRVFWRFFPFLGIAYFDASPDDYRVKTQM